MKYYHEFNAPTDKGDFIKVERNKLNPLPGRTFVSIAYYKNSNGLYAIIF